MKITFRHILACCVGLVGCATDVSNDATLDDEFELGGGKADGGEDIHIRAIRGGSLVTLYGQAAADLWNIYEEAGYEVTRSFGGLERVRGSYAVCITNRTAAACQLITGDASEVEGFDLAIHGPRFRSAASEIFGAAAAATGVDARSTTSVDSGLWLCEKNSADVWCGVRGTRDSVSLELSLVGLGDLGPDFVYEGWLITSEGPVTSGRFALESGDETRVFDIDPAIAADSTLFVLTIEPAVGDDPGPSDTHVVAGAFGDDGAELTMMHPGAFGTDFGDAMGGYILETPSSAATDDYNQGIWFVNPAAGAASLELPELPAGWVYEGWVVGEDGPVSTGTFLSATGADSDAGGPAAGPNGTPPFPGQDFVDPAMDLVGGAVVISVEPSPDNSPMPFFLKPLVDGNAEDVGPGVVQEMGNNAVASGLSGFAAFN